MTAPELGAWEAAQTRERRRREEAQRARDRDWAEEASGRRRFKDGNGLPPRYVSIPVDDPAPGAPRFVLVRQD